VTGRAQLSRVYGVETWSVYDVLDESLAPSGPQSLHDLAGTYLKPGMRVLDAGCRDAAHLIRLIRRCGVTGVGVDPVEVHVERANAAVDDAGVADRAEIFFGVIEDLPFPDGHFDFVWCRDVIEQVDDLDAALREMLRVLSPTGRMLVYTTFVTDRLTTQEAEMMNRHLGNVPANLVEANVERAFAGAGWAIERKDVIGTEWREHLEERGALCPGLFSGCHGCGGGETCWCNASGKTSTTTSRPTCTGTRSSFSASSCRSCTSSEGSLTRARA
jgi:SAM-dependent methyltransferase